MDFSLMWHLWFFLTLPLEVQLFSFIYDLVTYQGTELSGILILEL